MSKDIKDVCFVIQGQLNSSRVPGKMMIDLYQGKTMIDIASEKILQSKVIPRDQFYWSVYDDEIIEIAHEYELQVCKRELDGPDVKEEVDLRVIYEWAWQLADRYKYCVLINACNILLSVETIDDFVRAFLDSDEDGMFGVVERKTYFWDKDGQMVSKWPHGFKIMNTKYVEPLYEAGHCLYAGTLEQVRRGYWMSDNTPPTPALYIIKNELEIFDIDWPWQVPVAKELYRLHMYNLLGMG